MKKFRVLFFLIVLITILFCGCNDENQKNLATEETKTITTKETKAITKENKASITTENPNKKYYESQYRHYMQLPRFTGSQLEYSSKLNQL